MALRSVIEFIPSAAPIPGFTTKFGGQPAWLEAPQWPLSRQTGQPMQFIGQIALDPRLFPGSEGEIAYVFMTCAEVDGTWEPDGGENAVIIQPGPLPPPVEVSAQATGPVLFEEGDDFVHVEREYHVKLATGEDPAGQDRAPNVDGHGGDDPDDITVENKIGGHACFIQNYEYPAGDGWRLLLQLDSTSVPFWVNFGDAGVAYLFLNADGTAGKMLWQCA